MRRKLARDGGEQTQERGDAGGEAIQGRGAVFTRMMRLVATIDTPGAPLLLLRSRATKRADARRRERVGA